MKTYARTLGTATITLAMSFGLTGCQKTYSSADAKTAPEYPLSVAYTTDAEPEGLVTIVANQPTKGLASSYDPRLQKFETASGEDYDPRKMTAAHSSLPFASYVKIRNLNNMKETVVKINDRLEDAENETVKLSYAAAYRLGIYSGGTANVEIIPIGVETSAKQQKRPTQAKANANSRAEVEVKDLIKPAASKPVVASTEQAEIDATGLTVDTSGITQNSQTVTTAEPSLTLTPAPMDKAAESNSLGLEPLTFNSELQTATKQTFIQIGAFRNRAYAESMLESVQQLANANQTEVSIFETQTGGEPMYKVRFGPLKADQVNKIESVVATNNLSGLTVTN